MFTALHLRSSICFSRKNVCTLGYHAEVWGFPSSHGSQCLDLAWLHLTNASPVSCLLSSDDPFTCILSDKGSQRLRVCNSFMVELDLMTFGSKAWCELSLYIFLIWCERLNTSLQGNEHTWSWSPAQTRRGVSHTQCIVYYVTSQKWEKFSSLKHGWSQKLLIYYCGTHLCFACASFPRSPSTFHWTLFQQTQILWSSLATGEWMPPALGWITPWTQH